MPVAAAIAPLLQGIAGQDFGLYLGGHNVAPLTPTSSIVVKEAGPGGVSSMSFVIEDPTGIAGLPVAGSEIRMQDLTLDVPIFLGWLNDWTAEVYGVGRIFSINAIGIEAALDWTIVPSTGIGSVFAPRQLVDGSDPVISGLASYAAWMGLKAPIPTSSDPIDGDADKPIGFLSTAGDPYEIDYDGPFFAGPSDLRTAITYATRVTRRSVAAVLDLDALVTVDFNRRLRVFRRGFKPADYTNLTVNDAYAGPLVAASLKYEVHPGDVPHGVYVVGGNPAGTGWVEDTSGVRGRMDLLNSTDSGVSISLTAIGEKYLAAQAMLVRGSLVLESYVPSVGTIHPGSFITITDTQVSQVAQIYAIATITKTFPGGVLQEWMIEFGSSAPSYVESVARRYATDPVYPTMLPPGVRS